MCGKVAIQLPYMLKCGMWCPRGFWNEAMVVGGRAWFFVVEMNPREHLSLPRAHHASAYGKVFVLVLLTMILILPTVGHNNLDWPSKCQSGSAKTLVPCSLNT